MNMRTTWKQPGTAIVHGVTVSGLHVQAIAFINGVAYGRPVASFMRTDCGLQPEIVNLAGEGPVSCVPCLEAHGDLAEKRDDRAPVTSDREPVAA